MNRKIRLSSSLLLALTVVAGIVGLNAASIAAAQVSPPLQVILSTGIAEDNTTTFTIWLKNITSTPITGIVLNATIPAGMTLVDSWAEAPDRYKANLSGSTLSWVLRKDVKANAPEGPFVFIAKPAGALTTGQKFKAVAWAGWETPPKGQATSNVARLEAVGSPATLVAMGLGTDLVTTNGMVGAAHPLAAQAGIEMLRKGGNAIDAAVAVNFALGCVDPMDVGLGGYGGHMIIYLAKTKETVVIEYSTVVPSKGRPDLYELLPPLPGQWWRVKDDAQTLGYKASSIPGVLAGTTTALEKYGTMSLKEVMQPAIRLAEDGFPVNKFINSAMVREVEKLRKFPETAKIWLKNGEPYKIGDIIYLKDYAKTLKKISEGGPDVFYRGEIADIIAADMEKNGGLITKKDLMNYKPLIIKPVKTNYRGYDILTSGTNSGGDVVAQTLAILNNVDMKSLGSRSADSIHMVAEALKLTWTDRLKFWSDPNFIKVPLAGMRSAEYNKEQAKRIDPKMAARKPKPGDPWPYGGNQTTHCSVIDKDGNMVALTNTLMVWWGSGVTIPGTGILMNTGMNMWNPTPGTANQIEPGKRSITNMAPTLVAKDGMPLMTMGTPGARWIQTMVINFIIDTVDYGKTIYEAVGAPRFHIEADEPLWIEETLPESTAEVLKAMGHDVRIRQSATVGGPASGIMFDRVTGTLSGGCDPRAPGAIVGY